MALSWNEIRSRATTFAFEWRNEGYEKGQSQTFWIEFFSVFGVSQKRVGSFEKKVKKLDGKDGYIDFIWHGVLIGEQKSRGKDLTRAYHQARDYFHGLKDYELPRFILVCNFERFRLYDLIDNTEIEFSLEELPDKIHLFGFMIGLTTKADEKDDQVSIAAAERMARLHDSMKAAGYTGRDLEQYLVRLLFCMFADDTSIFEKNIFREFIARTNEDGSDLASALDTLFFVLNTPEDKRLLTLDERLRVFPYVNGGLFADRLAPAAFDAEMREALLECCAFDWGFISPSIFGSMFQAAMSPAQRRELGAHYTEEVNILKVVNPLFMDELREEFESIRTNKKKLETFHDKLATLKFMDPACGTGNFLIIAYRELRKLELDVLMALYTAESAIHGATIQQVLAIEYRAKVNVDQFYGIEIDEFACEIARVGMWLMDHQCNRELSNKMGLYYRRLPLEKSAKIVHGNALRIDWQEVCPAYELSYILGNPPFCGMKYQSASQKEDLKLSANEIDGYGVLDYISGWFVKAARYISAVKIKVAFVSTNSICQGEQVYPLWNTLIDKYGVVIEFAYRTFVWTSAARGKAAVHCIIIGFCSFNSRRKKYIYESSDNRIVAENINPYLVDARNTLIKKRRNPICDVPRIIAGNKPVDGDNLKLEDNEMRDLVSREPLAGKYIKRLIGGREFLYSEKRWVIWLVNVDPVELKKMSHVLERVERVRKARLAMTDNQARKLADTPTTFRDTMNPDSYVVIPIVTSENRKYIPMGFLDSSFIPTNQVQIIPGATTYHFGVLMSSIHMSWVNAVCGRLESRFRYTGEIVYNNFPWPSPTDKQKKDIEDAACNVLNVRDQYPNASLAVLYGPLSMPPELVKAHHKLDQAVKAAYGGKGFATEAERVADLMRRYAELVQKK